MLTASSLAGRPARCNAPRSGRDSNSGGAVGATAQQAKELGVRRGAPLLQMREIHFGEGDRRLLYSINHHNSAVIDLTLARAGMRA